MSKQTASLTQKCPNASDALLYERLCLAEQQAWEFVKATIKVSEQALEEWESATTAKRVFEESLEGEKNHDSNQRPN